MRVHRLSHSLLIAVTLLGTSGLGWAQGEEEGEAAAQPSPTPRPSVRDVAAAYRGARFDECVDTAKQLLDPKQPDHLREPSEIDAATTYLGTCLVRTGRTKEAEDLFEEWIYVEFAKRNAVPAKPNVAIYGAAAADAYDIAYQRVSERLESDRIKALAALDKAKDDEEQAAKAEAARQAALLEFAAHETVVTRNRRWIATIPFGVGQFQNGKPRLGWLFLTTEAAAAAVTLGGMIAELELAAHAPNQVEGRREADRPFELNTGQDRARLTWVVGLYTFTALAAGGIAEAHLNYVPRFEETRKRPVPKELREPIEPKPRLRIAPLGLPGGAGLGVTGRF